MNNQAVGTAQNPSMKGSSLAKIFTLVYKISILVAQLIVFLVMSFGGIKAFGESITIFSVSTFTAQAIIANVAAITMIIYKLAIAIVYVIFEIVALVSIIKSATKIGTLLRTNCEEELKAIKAVDKACFSTINGFIFIICFTNLFSSYNLNVFGIIGCIIAMFAFASKELYYYFQVEKFEIKAFLFKLGNICFKLVAFTSILCLIMGDYINEFVSNAFGSYGGGAFDKKIMISALWKFEFLPFAMIYCVFYTCKLARNYTKREVTSEKRNKGLINLLVSLGAVIVLNFIDVAFFASGDKGFNLVNALGALSLETKMQFIPALLMCVAFLLCTKFESEEETSRLEAFVKGQQPNTNTQNYANPYGMPQYGQPQYAPYGQPQYGQPVQSPYGQPMQPQYPPYGQPQYGQPTQPMNGQPQYPPYVQPQYGQPVQPMSAEPTQPQYAPYGQPQYSQPQYSQPVQPTNVEPVQPQYAPYGQSQYSQPVQPTNVESVQPQYAPYGQSQYSQPVQPTNVEPVQPQYAPYGQSQNSESAKPAEPVDVQPAETNVESAFAKANDEIVITEAVANENSSNTQENKKSKKYSFEDEE